MMIKQGIFRTFPQHSPSYGAHSAEDQEHTMVHWKSPTPKNRHHEPQNDGCTDLEMRLSRWQSHKPPMFSWLPTIKFVKQGVVYYCFTDSTMAVTLLQTFTSMGKLHHECRSFSERGSMVVLPIFLLASPRVWIITQDFSWMRTQTSWKHLETTYATQTAWWLSALFWEVLEF